MPTMKARRILTPLGLNSEKDPHPSPGNFQKHEQEDATFDVVDLFQSLREAAHPGETQNEIDDDRAVVQSIVVKRSVSSQPKRIIPTVAARREQGQVPILSDVPVEGVGRVNETRQNPGGNFKSVRLAHFSFWERSYQSRDTATSLSP